MVRGSIQQLRNILEERGPHGFDAIIHGDQFDDDSYYPCGKLLLVIEEGAIQINCHRCKRKWQYSLDDFSVAERPDGEVPGG